MNLKIILISLSLLKFTLGFQGSVKKSSKIPHFVAEIIKDEIKTNQNLRDVAIITAENNFSHDFHQKVIKNLPEEIPKIIFNFELFFIEESFLNLTKSTFVIFIADYVENVS